MLTVVFGESCTGKSTFAEQLKTAMEAELMTGKDYLRLAKSESAAKDLFRKRMQSAAAGEADLLWVIAEKDHLAMVPQGAVRVLMTADLDIILARFAARLHKQDLPEPVRSSLARKHGCFDREVWDYHIHNGVEAQAVLRTILEGGKPHG